MTLSEKIFALKSITPFDGLRDGELALIAQEARAKQYRAGEVICGPDHPIRSLHVVIGGSAIRLGDNASLPIFGIKAMLFNSDPGVTVVGGDEGAACLLIRRGNLFTIANECPSLIVGFLALAETGILI